jgi:hypothetical protein
MIVAGILTGIWGGSLIVSAAKSHPPESTAQVPASPDGSADPAARTLQAALARTPSFIVPVVGARF